MNDVSMHSSIAPQSPAEPSTFANITTSTDGSFLNTTGVTDPSNSPILNVSDNNFLNDTGASTTMITDISDNSFTSLEMMEDGEDKSMGELGGLDGSEGGSRGSVDDDMDEREAFGVSSETCILKNDVTQINIKDSVALIKGSLCGTVLKLRKVLKVDGEHSEIQIKWDAVGTKTR